MPPPRLISLLSSLLMAMTLRAAGPEADHPTLDGVKAVEDPSEAARRLVVAPGLRADLWAAEPRLENPVSFTFDARGRCFVAETFRRKTSALDIRPHPPWLSASLAMRSVEDRLAFLQQAFADQKAAPFLGIVDRDRDGLLDWRDLAVESERVVVVEDRDGDGRADSSAVFAEGFKTAVTGIGAGVLAHGGDVLFTCLPDLWRLRDSRRDALLTGFGVHITYAGHDLHGLAIGPDGKLYWTTGDCGARVTTQEGRVLDVPDTGAVFRANLDGSQCEVVMRGLRNPVELCFNDEGDLFTADNNGDGGDLARWVQVVEGGDAGWQIGWQSQPGLGAWGAERLWAPEVVRTALALLPPVGTLGHGPAGVAFYPGTGLPEMWRRHFFVCDFPGGVRAFRLEARGAGYAIAASQRALHDNGFGLESKLVWGCYPTDVDFAPGGGVYVLDWVRDVEKPGKGRIFRLHDAATDASPLVRETRELLGADFSGKSAEELARLLGHADRRVRLAAQFALAAKDDLPTLAKIAASGDSRLARLHAVWGLGQLGGSAPDHCRELLRDGDSEVRAQAARVLGGARATDAAPALIAALADAEPRVRASVALALGRIGAREAVPALLGVLRTNGDADALLRHAAVMGLAGCADVATLLAATDDASDAVRAGVLLALRRLERPEIARFLDDRNPQLVLEAARAIYDTPIDTSMPALAALASRTDLAAPVAARALEAYHRVGDAASAKRLAAIAADREAAEGRRVEALDALGGWNRTDGRDRFLGLWRPLPVTRDSRAAVAALAPVIASLLRRPEGERVRMAAVNAVSLLSLHEADSALAGIVAEGKASGALRAAALQALAAMSSPRASSAIKTARAEADPALRAMALDLDARLDPENAAEAASNVLKSGTLAEKQNALRTLGAIKGKVADKHLGKWLDRFLKGEVPRALHLDLLDAAAQRDKPEIQQKLAAIDAARQGRLGPWRECLEGGDASRGRAVFSEKAEAGCLRCHKVRGVGGEVGPELGAIGARRDRVAILKAILFPNDDFAPGYESVVLALKDGRDVAGVVTAEDAHSVTLRAPGDGQPASVALTDIVRRTRLPSAMPEGLGAVLGKRDLRDVVEFLAGQK